MEGIKRGIGRKTSRERWRRVVKGGVDGRTPEVGMDGKAGMGKREREKGVGKRENGNGKSYFFPLREKSGTGNDHFSRREFPVFFPSCNMVKNNKIFCFKSTLFARNLCDASSQLKNQGKGR